jgi:hypothetical protein
MDETEFSQAVHERLASQCETTISINSGRVEVLGRANGKEARYEALIGELDVDQAVTRILEQLAAD